MNFNIYKNIKIQGDLVFLCLILFFGLLLNKTTITEGFRRRSSTGFRRRPSNKCTIYRKKKTKRKRDKMKREVTNKEQQNIHGWQFEKVTGPDCKPKKLKLRYRKGDEIIEEKTLDDIIYTIKNKEGIEQTPRKNKKIVVKPSKNVFIIVVGVLFTIIASVGIGFFIYKLFRRRRKKNLN